jgi:hypothetical protein
VLQALREKEKANPPNVSPFVGGDDFDDEDYDAIGSPLQQKRSRLSPAPSDGSAPRTKRKILHQSAAVAKRNDHADNSDEETSSDNEDDDDDDGSSSDSDDDNESSTTSEEDIEEEVKHSIAAQPSPAAAAAAATAAVSVQAAKKVKVNKPKQLLPVGGSGAPSMTALSPATREDVALVMMNRLRAFWSTHGHAAVPPIWPRDQKFADWCIQQRQLHREVIRRPKITDIGASEPNGTTVGKGDDLVAATEKKTGATTTTETTEPPTPANATTNVANDHHQQQQPVEPYRRGTPAETRRIEALNRLGFCWDYAAWHWEYQYQRLVAQVAPKRNDERQQTPASLHKTTEKEQQDSTNADAMEVDVPPTTKGDMEHMDVDKKSTTITNGNANETEARPENGNAMDVELNDADVAKKDAPSDGPQKVAGAAAASTSARYKQGVKDGLLCTVLNNETLEWMDDQQDQYHNQGHHLVSKKRRDKLEAMGIYF